MVLSISKDDMYLINLDAVLGSGIGRELAIAFVRAGIQNIALADIDLEGVAETARLVEAAAPKTKVLQISVNVTDEAAVNAMVNKTVSSFGGLDCGE
jgi:NAD(P)-dependent dehydrogenase (short-subunit alcohol dehydrogenase family)